MTQPRQESEEFFKAALEGDCDMLRSLIADGVDVNMREAGDNTYAMHWAAAAGQLEAVRVLADAGGDVVGRGDDHNLEVIGWATCWDGCDDDAHRSVADFLVARGARHHIFSAIAMRLEDVVRGIVHEDRSALSSRMSRNENYQTPLHFSVRMERHGMTRLLLELGANPSILDGFGQPAAAYARSTTSDHAVMEAILENDTSSVSPGLRLLAAISLGDFDRARSLVQDDPHLLNSGALHLMAKRGDSEAARWLLDHGADPNARWAHFDASVTPLHMVCFSGDLKIARMLLNAGGDPTIPDSRHDSDALGWAEHFGQVDLRALFRNPATEGYQSIR